MSVYFGMMADDYSNDPDSGGPAAEKMIEDAFVLLKAFPKKDHYVAWLRWNGDTYVTCDSDAEGAFRVCRDPWGIE